MQVQKQINELLALRASEWVEILPTASREQLREFEAWLCESPLHVREFLEVAEVEFSLNHIDPTRQLDVENLLKRIAPEVSSLRKQAAAGPFAPPETKRLWRIAAFATAASVLFALGIVFTTRYLDDSKRYTTVIGEQRVVELPDTSVITLNADSQIKVRLEETNREIDLRRGEALFRVAHDPTRPFRVHMRAGFVQAVGTQFNVNTLMDGSARVSVLEGAVRAVSRTGKELMLGAGAEADLRLDGSIAPREHPIVSNTVAWRQHRLVFDSASIQEMTAEFNRYNQSVHLRVEGLEGDRHRFDGSFDATDPQAFIELLSREPDLAIERQGGEVVIRRR
jgi:transmembrane sensor